ncbi:MAG: T9SS type A sorting domain-containing protein [bacterium]
MKSFNYLIFIFMIMSFSVQLEAKSLDKEIRKNIPKSFLGLNISREWRFNENKIAIKKGNSAISGRVTEADGITPSPEMELIAFDAITQDGIDCGWGDSSGNYIITSLPAGNYKVWARDYDGRYINMYYKNTLSWDSADVVSIADSDTAKNIDFRMSKGGKIKGKVYESDGITGYKYALMPMFDNTTEKSVSLGFSDSLGNYMVGSLCTGIYKLLIWPNLSIENMYSFEWYNNKDNWTNANIINITAPDSVCGINIILDEGGAISGHVYKEDGITPISDVKLERLIYTNSYYGWSNPDYWKDSTVVDGSYKISALHTGSYKVSASKEGYETRWYNDKPDSASADLVSVTMPNNTPNIDFRLSIKAVEENKETIYFELKACPNPFINMTTIKYSLPCETKVSLKIYNICGKLVKTLTDEIQNAGEHSITWNRQNDKKERISIGIYFCKINTGEKNITEKLILIR